MKGSIKTQILAFITLLLLCLLVCQLIFSLFLSKRMFLRRQEEQLESLFYNIRDGYSDDADALYALTAQTRELYNVQIDISDGEARIYSSRSIPPFLHKEPFSLPYPANSYVENPQARPVGSAARPGLPDAPSIRLTGRFDYGGSVRYVTLSSPIEPIDASIAMFTQVNIAIAIAVLLLGAVSAWFFAEHLARPIRGMEEVAKHIAALSFDKTAGENIRTRELYSLSVSINAMAGKLEGMIGELEAANEKLRADVDYQKRLEKMRRTFIANVSHEMKTPLCMLMMYSENLRNDVPGIDRDYYLDTIMEEAARLDSMVKDLLELSSIENGLARLRLARVDISALSAHFIEKAAVLLAPYRLESEIAPGLAVRGDAHYLTQAIGNFITNAIAHTRAGGRIRISLCEAEGSARLRVYNEGSPIAEEDMEQIWESFYRADKARTQTEEKHVGLGLYIVKSIVEAHRGSCGAQNEEGGVAFYFRVPLWEVLDGETDQDAAAS